MRKVLDFICNLFRKGDRIPEVTIPSTYNLPSSVIPEWVSNDVKSQVKLLVESDTKLFEKVEKSGKVAVNFQTRVSNYRHFYRHRRIYLDLMGGEFFNLDSASDNLRWKRHQIINQILT